mmetsp:Transcript_27982/g.38342  ORF Transcript_27982/g.38342 Transcript_27982/m.38342 type:complete len:91 (+) Transcript_27982:306-578(+)
MRASALHIHLQPLHQRRQLPSEKCKKPLMSLLSKDDPTLHPSKSFAFIELATAAARLLKSSLARGIVMAACNAISAALFLAPAAAAAACF